jgi:ADP-ribosylation factor-binding protein GGA
MCEEDSEDHEAVAKLFEINDSIHRTIERYKLFKKGDIEGANNIPQGTLGRSGAGVKQGPNNTLNLIDFGDPEPAPQAAASSQAPQQPAAKGNALEDDLLGLSLSGDTYGQSGSISLGGSNGSGMSLNLVPHVHSLTILSSRHVWNGRPTIASPAKAIDTVHHRSFRIGS